MIVHLKFTPTSHCPMSRLRVADDARLPQKGDYIDLDDHWYLVGHVRWDYVQGGQEPNATIGVLTPTLVLAEAALL